MQLYGRGIRRRLAPMLGSDRRRIELAYALQFTLPGTPVLRYGEEIGMGDDLSLPSAGRDPDPDAVGGRGTGRLHHGRPAGPAGRSPRASTATRRSTCGTSSGDPGSLLSWFERMFRVLRECPEFGTGACAVLDTRSEQVLGLRYDGPSGSVLAVLNLGESPSTVDLAGQVEAADGFPTDELADREYEPAPADLSAVEVDGRGYRWLRLSRTVGA